MLPANWHKRYSGVVERERVLGPETSWRIGGPAQLYLEPARIDELVDTLDQLRRIGMPWRILGGGSNILVADRGLREAVISLRRLGAIKVEGDCIVAEAGAPLHKVVRHAATLGLAGAERLAGIPGCVGGAIFGNAGGKHGDIGSLTRGLDLLDPGGAAVHLTPQPGFFRYRHSAVGDRIVLRAVLQLAPDTPDGVTRRTEAIIRERLATQPGWSGNAGCVFKNPPGASAGRLIDLAGCKEMRHGALSVSLIHANFFENLGGATCDDVDVLVDRVRDAVRRVHGVEMEMEVRRWE